MAFQLARDQFGKKEVQVNLNQQDASSMSTEELAKKAYELLNKHNDDFGVDKEAFVAAVATQTAANN